ncbi:hypothetical protein AURDEDRAFT_52004 [Auricularia subglabra TFB-10046 SS5]|nr:hypothetical protein AURDEDRAFT_52004 [Auricularia subglabra TFB-10046 SS5]
MARVAAELGPPVRLELDDDAPFDAPGLRAQGLRQRDALRAIRLSEKLKLRPRAQTVRNLHRVQESIDEECDFMPTQAQIWTSLTSRDLSRQARNFLWKTVHGAHKIGEYFSKMPQPWKDYELCPTCNCVETMEHVLLECPDSRQEVIWDTVREFLARKRVDVDINMGTILGCATMRLAGYWGARSRGVERAFQIVVSESAFLVWKIRCEKRIQHAEDPDWQLPEEAARDRWVAVIKRRMEQDKILSQKQGFKKKALNSWLVEDTWLDLRNTANYDMHLLRVPGVLVGIGEAGRNGVG